MYQPDYKYPDTVKVPQLFRELCYSAIHMLVSESQAINEWTNVNNNYNLTELNEYCTPILCKKNQNIHVTQTVQVHYLDGKKTVRSFLYLI